MLVPLELKDNEEIPTSIPTYGVQTVRRSVGFVLDDLIPADRNVHVVSFVPSLDKEGLDDAACLYQNAQRLHEISGSDVLVTLPFLRSNGNAADSLRVAQAIRDDMASRGHRPPRSTFLLYLELQRVDDGHDVIGFVKDLDRLDERQLGDLASKWREAATTLAPFNGASPPGAFYREVHGGLLPSKLEWILAASEIISIATAIKKWLGFFTSRS